MTLSFKDMENVLFNPDMVTALNKGETLQIKGGWGPNAEEWRDWKAEGDYFGPWYYHKAYEWRVKPATVKIEVDRETEMVVKTIEKVAVDIPAPLEGEVPKDSCYHRVYKDKSARKWKIYYNHYNYTPSLAQQHVNSDLVYLDADTAREAFKILTGE